MTTEVSPAADACALAWDTLTRNGQAPTLTELLKAGLGRLPLPARGQTLLRWSILAKVAACDLSLAKMFEGHVDALAILAELGATPAPEASVWGTWCAEPPYARVEMQPGTDASAVVLRGRKAWCSGAASVTHAVVSCWNEAGEQCLAAVAIDQPGVLVTQKGWDAVGMAGSGSVEVVFDGALAEAVGKPGDYTRRPGFWHGGAGIAACWLGGAIGIARLTQGFIGSSQDPYKMAHLGAIDTALTPALALLRDAARQIDRLPRDDAHGLALSCRLAAEATCEVVMNHAGRALGAGPFCRDARFARAMADLPVYLRQSHAERDLASLGQVVAAHEDTARWSL